MWPPGDFSTPYFFSYPFRCLGTYNTFLFLLDFDETIKNNYKMKCKQNHFFTWWPSLTYKCTIYLKYLIYASYSSNFNCVQYFVYSYLGVLSSFKKSILFMQHIQVLHSKPCIIKYENMCLLLVRTYATRKVATSIFGDFI